MFERFTSEARGALVAAQRVASELRSPTIRRHHILVGIIDSYDPGGVVGDIFRDADVDPSQLRQQLMASLSGTEQPLPEAVKSPPFTAEAKKALELSLREALQGGHNYIADFHLVLAILRTADGPLRAVLDTTKLDLARAQSVVRDAAPRG